jgi:hypothetical protein
MHLVDDISAHFVPSGQFGLDMPSFPDKFLVDWLGGITRALDLFFGRQIGGALVALGLISILWPVNTTNCR